MHLNIHFRHIALLLSAILAWSGCAKSGDQVISSPPPAEFKPEEHGHDHGGHPETGHPHVEHGPHQGQLIDLGHGEYHAEVVHDDTTNTIIVYLLDSSAKAAAPIAAESEVVLNLSVDGAPLQGKLVAAPQEGDPAGQASRFSISDAKVMEALDSPKTLSRLLVKTGNKEFSEKIPHEEHGEHSHK